MNKKVLTIVSCLLILAISATLLLIILLVVDKNNNENELPYSELTCNVNDINMKIGDKLYDFYSFNQVDVDVSFEIDKEGIINIDKNCIDALSTGKVTVVITGIKGDKCCQKQFIVTVTDEDYKIKIIPILNCRVNENMNTIYMESNSCQFYLEIYNESNVKLDNINYKLNCENQNVVLDCEFINYLLITNENCKLILSFEKSSVKIEINVECL